jgi:hypothetical protein
MHEIANSVFKNKGRHEAFTRKITLEGTVSLSEVCLFTL